MQQRTAEDNATADAHVSGLLHEAGVRARATPGQVLAREGDDDTRVHLVERGQVKLSIRAGTGFDLAVALVGPGELFGTLEAVDGRAAATTATAITACELVGVDAARFRRALAADPRLAGYVLRLLSSEIRRADRQLAEHCGQPTRARVATQLLARSGPGHRLYTTQSDLAEWVGTTRESTARALGELREAGWIVTGRGWIGVRDREALARLRQP